jgi:hypothetical protein
MAGVYSIDSMANLYCRRIMAIQKVMIMWRLNVGVMANLTVQWLSDY